MRILKSLIILSTMILGVTANSAIPPLDQEDREAYSSHIITGVVAAINETTQKNGYQNIDKIYTVTMVPTSVEKGDDYSVSVSFTFWKAFVRPEGMCGPIGQYGMIKTGDQIRVYLQKDEENNYRVLEPNGFDKL